MEGYEAGLSKQGFALLLSALHKVCPSVRYKTSSAVLIAWGARLPPKQAPAIPEEFKEAMCVTLVLLGLKHEALALKLCFHGLLRISEALMLKEIDIVWPTDGSHAVVLLLGLTKRGRDQKVTVQDASTLSWLAAFFQDQPKAKDSRICKCSYNQVRRAITVASKHLGFSEAGFSSHSFRRGGATSMLIKGVPMMNIMHHGRWASEKSCREYLNRGEVFMLRFLNLADPGLKERIRLLASLGVQAFHR